MAAVLTGISGIGKGILWIVGGLIHLWTIYIVYTIHGVFMGIVAFFFPVVSQVYVMYISTVISETFLTTYNVIILGYVGTGIIMNIVFGLALSKADSY